jgi:hypothetical protein
MTGAFTAALIAGAAGQAMASAWPASVVGVWSMSANQSGLTLTISTQKGSGTCKVITGTLVDVFNGNQSNTIQGFYCPTSGRIHFLRIDTTTGQTFQVFAGNLSYPGSPTYMAGNFAEDGGSTPGEYDFFASK